MSESLRSKDVNDVRDWISDEILELMEDNTRRGSNDSSSDPNCEISFDRKRNEAIMDRLFDTSVGRANEPMRQLHLNARFTPSLRPASEGGRTFVRPAFSEGNPSTTTRPAAGVEDHRGTIPNPKRRQSR